MSFCKLQIYTETDRRAQFPSLCMYAEKKLDCVKDLERMENVTIGKLCVTELLFDMEGGH